MRFSELAEAKGPIENMPGFDKEWPGTKLDKDYYLKTCPIIPGEKDPKGFDQHTPGAKLDAGKVRAALVLGDFANALWAVCEIGTFGANKYTAHGWLSVPEGQERYDDAKMRHWLKNKMGEELDPDSNLDHLKHEAWNALARLELKIRKQKELNRLAVNATTIDLDVTVVG